MENSAGLENSAKLIYIIEVKEEKIPIIMNFLYN